MKMTQKQTNRQSQRSSPARRRGARRGVAYITTLGITSLVAVMGLGALLAVRSQGRAVDASNDVAEANQLALSGLELGRLWIKNDSGWRKTYDDGAGNYKKTIAVGTGSIYVDLVDPVDGNVKNKSDDPVLVIATGQKGNARQTVQCRLTSSSSALTCLNTPVLGDKGVTFSTATVATSGRALSSNKNMSSSLSTVNPAVEANGTIGGTSTNYKSTKTTGITAYTMPDSTVLDYYTTNGTAIDISGMGTTPILQKFVLSPGNNPWGSTNSQGIYVINCLNKNVTIRDCRIVGTLVLKNVGAGSSIAGSVYWRPAVTGYPCLLVDSSIPIKTVSAALSESTLATNFNPANTPEPYPGGASDSANDDSYTSEIYGLVYMASDVTIGSTAAGNRVAIGNLICGGALTITGNYTPDYDGSAAANPPPGFGSNSVALQAGSYAKVTN